MEPCKTCKWWWPNDGVVGSCNWHSPGLPYRSGVSPGEEGGRVHGDLSVGHVTRCAAMFGCIKHKPKQD